MIFTLGPAVIVVGLCVFEGCTCNDFYLRKSVSEWLLILMNLANSVCHNFFNLMFLAIVTLAADISSNSLRQNRTTLFFQNWD